ncbi:cupin domain-containing protein [Microvirga splendida]|uniref:Cupin domain-containing protein n=1 Tax=Microvirga splendida TaxID=2795727 RepID=A0ABS0Y5Y3_9HYPH|nr:cupin domain-containing protein [Microvirga splendida]MBJ6127722.1 cupin domain-containing protein [Microvirga splendida]
MNRAAMDHRNLWFLNARVTIRISSQDSSDGISVLEHHASQGDSPPLHVHHNEDEIFHVLEGEVRYRVGDQERQASAGETLLTPKGIPHTYRVESAEARMLTITRGEFENFIRALGRPADRQGLPDLSGPLTPEQAEALARACRQFGIELVGPPLS